MLTLYGRKLSRAARCLWALEELGLPYRQVPIDTNNGESRREGYLALNPAGKVPTLVDEDFVLRESVAINHYLVGLAPNPLWPDQLRVQALILQWSSWSVTEVEFHFTLVVRELRRAAAAEEAPDAKLVGDALSAVSGTLATLEAHLAGGTAWVAGDAFTIGDVNTAFPIIGLSQRIDMAPFPAIRDWLARCTSRPAWHRVQAIDEEKLRAAFLA
ncbi:glutathione S-transferase family protein [Sphingosinicella terrae]|uniref:glutathione S-transferase family protein n=1 Tax=Sphingosinicella terrae TaxID=2172047 RepID=UPI000E0DC0F9|nr:glutathione S-transferase family protein [Sphingosinicella terrae]